eukprot:6122109-Prymnesium_polylepis.1
MPAVWRTRVLRPMDPPSPPASPPPPPRVRAPASASRACASRVLCSSIALAACASRCLPARAAQHAARIERDPRPTPLLRAH